MTSWNVKIGIGGGGKKDNHKRENYGGKTEVRSSHFGVFSILQLFLLANSSVYSWVLCSSQPGWFTLCWLHCQLWFHISLPSTARKVSLEKLKYCMWKSKRKVLTGTSSLGEGRPKKRLVIVFRQVQGACNYLLTYVFSKDWTKLKPVVSPIEGTLEFIWLNILTLKPRHLW